MLFSWVISKTESVDSSNSTDATVSEPDGDTAFAVPLSSLIAKPGLLSITCSPGNRRMVVFSVISLSFPVKYENLADSISALCTVLKGLVREFP